MSFKSRLLRVHSLMAELRIPDREINSISLYCWENADADVSVRIETFLRVLRDAGKVANKKINSNAESIHASFTWRKINWRVVLLSEIEEDRAAVLEMMSDQSHPIRKLTGQQKAIKRIGSPSPKSNQLRLTNF